MGRRGVPGLRAGAEAAPWRNCGEEDGEGRGMGEGREGDEGAGEGEDEDEDEERMTEKLR